LHRLIQVRFRQRWYNYIYIYIGLYYIVYVIIYTMIHTYLHMRIFIYDTEWQTSNVLDIIEKQIYRLVKYGSSDRRNPSTLLCTTSATVVAVLSWSGATSNVAAAIRPVGAHPTAFPNAGRASSAVAPKSL